MNDSFDPRRVPPSAERPALRSSYAEWVAAGMVVAGVALLVASLVLPWYVVDLPSDTGAPNAPGAFVEQWGLWSVGFKFPPTAPVACPSNVNCTTGPSTSSWAWSFDQASLPDLAGVYLTAAFLVAVAVAFAVVALGLGMLGRPADARTRTIARGAFLALAVVCAIAAPALVAAEQPSVVCSDWRVYGPQPLGHPSPIARADTSCPWLIVGYGGGGTGWSGPGSPRGPGNSFVGSNASTGASWGPGTGWFLPVLATAFLAGGLALGVLTGTRARTSGMPPVKPI